MDTDGTGWRFAQCFGDKGEVEDITEGMCTIIIITTIVMPVRG